MRESDDEQREIIRLRTALVKIAQYDRRWSGMHSNDAPSRQELIEVAFNAVVEDSNTWCDGSTKGR